MTSKESEQLNKKDLSEGKLVDQEPLEPVEDPPVSHAGYNQIPDFGDDTDETLLDPDKD